MNARIEQLWSTLTREETHGSVRRKQSSRWKGETSHNEKKNSHCVKKSVKIIRNYGKTINSSDR